jgi:hypothetical protein
VLDPDPKAHTRPAREARWRKYLDQVPAAITDPAERTRRAHTLLQADMQALALRASAARKAAAKARLKAEAAEAEFAEFAGEAAEAARAS